MDKNEPFVFHLEKSGKKCIYAQGTKTVKDRRGCVVRLCRR